MALNPLILPGDDPASIEQAAEVLRNGGLVGIPTETVYGLAANAIDANAVAKIFEAKQRPSFDPLIVHFNSLEWVYGYVELEVGTRSDLLAESFWPGPLTVVVPRVEEPALPELAIPDIVTSGLPTVAIRVPAHPVALALLNKVDFPLAAPSANRFGSISPTTAQHVADELGDRVDLILDGGACERGLESTVVREGVEGFEVLRLGALSVDMIERALGERVNVRPPSSAPGKSGTHDALPSPGLTDRHYAPGTPMTLVKSLDALSDQELHGKIGLIGFGPLPQNDTRFVSVKTLSGASDINEAATRLFATLRELDTLNLDRIIALAVPDEGIGRAINDRLRRGSAR